MPIFRADSAFDEARKDGGTLSGLPVRGIADEATGLFALASGPASSSNDALERLQRASTEAFGLEARQLAELVRAELLRLPPSVEATALFVNAAGVAMLGQRGQHPAFALHDGRLLRLTSDASVADDPHTLVTAAPGSFSWSRSHDLPLAAASRAAITAEQMGFLRAQRADTVDVRRAEAEPDTTYLLLSQTVGRALGFDVLWTLLSADTGPWALLQAARSAHPGQQRGMGAVIVRVG
jgi:hypothetical protein